MTTAVKPDVVKPDVVKPDVVKPDVVKPDVVKPNTVTPKRGKRNSIASTQPTDSQPVRHIGVGIDTARYGHRVNFLREDKQLAAKAVTITENREGYDLLRTEFETLHQRHSEAMFHVHKDYHSAVSPKKKSDNTESLAMARFGVVEKPVPTRPIPPAFIILREIASRLQEAVKIRLVPLIGFTIWSALKGVTTLAATHDLAHTFSLETQRMQPPQPQEIPPKETPENPASSRPTPS